MRNNKPNRNYEIWCDKHEDKELLKILQSISKSLSSVESIRVIPNRNHQLLQKDPETAHIAPLLIYDRPDFIICIDGKPIFVAELTEHGYTGDMCMQRFARIVCAAEQRVPLVYFTPFSRTRLGELLDLAPNQKASSRRVSGRMFRGLVRLSEIYEVPIVAVDWPVTSKGTPAKPKDTKNVSELKSIYGDLVETIELIAFKNAGGVLTGEDIRKSEGIADLVEKTRRLWRESNIRDSDVAITDKGYGDILNAIIANEGPQSLIDLKYFEKGKRKKLIALLAINFSRIRLIQGQDGKMIHNPGNVKELLRALPTTLGNKEWLIYYFGYQWRGEPNGGILANAEIIYCRSPKGKTPAEKDKFLMAWWPRIFWDKDSRYIDLIRKDIRSVNEPRTTSKLAEMYRVSQHFQRDKKPFPVGNIKKEIGVWNENSSVARIWRRFADLILLNDALLLGDTWIRN